MKLDTTTLQAESASSEALYKINIIDKDGIMGSCEDYGTRKPVTHKMVAQMTYEGVLKRYGNKFVIVADQDTRTRTLIPQNLYIPEHLIHIEDYVILERVGRSRFHGERTCGKNSLHDITSDPRSNFHRRETLRKHGLIAIARDTLYLYALLPRFRQGMAQSSREIAIMRIMEEAAEDPKREITVRRSQEILREVCHDEPNVSWKTFRKCSAMSSNFTVTKDRRPCAKNKKGDVAVYLLKLKHKDVGLDDEEAAGKKNSSSSPFLNTDGQYYGVSVSKQVLITIEVAGLTGVTTPEMSQILGLPKPNVRNAVRGLEKSGEIVQEKRQLKKSLVTFLISTKLKQQMEMEEKEQLTIKRVVVEKEKPLELSLVDVYGVTTTVTAEATEKFASNLNIDTASRKERLKTSLETIQELGITTNLQLITNIVSEKLGQVVCRKTMRRLIQYLTHKGQVGIYWVTMQREKVRKSTHIFIDRGQYSSGMAHPKFMETLQGLHKKMVPLVNLKLESLSKKQLDTKMRPSDKRFLHFPTLKNIHKFLMHLAWYRMTSDPDQLKPVSVVPPEWQRALPADEQLLPVYNNEELGWKTFLPPRNVTDSPRGFGWVTIQEICETMPLQMVADMYKPIDNARNVPEILKHPVKRFYMMQQLPTAALVNNPWFVDTLFITLQKLCFLGFLRFGVVEPHKKIAIPIYMNRRRVIVDTVTKDYMKEPPPSWPSKQKRHSYEFTTPDVVHKFWSDMTRICINTLLSRCKLKGYIGTVRDLASTIQPIDEKDAEKLDDGSSPGDGRGAAGSHSGMAIHMYHYWDRVFTSASERRRITRTPKPPRVGVNTNNRPKKERVYKKLFDEVDVYAKGTGNGMLRTRWTAAEDTALLLSRLANMYISNNRSNLHIVSCITYRDVVHWICGSLDKTAKMCSRRVLFLCKNDVTKATLDICLKEMSHTKAVTERFPPNTLQKLKEAYPGEEEYASVVKINFIELVEILSGIFSKITSTSFQKRVGSVLPDNTEKFLARYKVLDDAEEPSWEKCVKKEDRIKLHTVYNIIHSSMCCAEDGLEYNLILLDIYKDYPEQVLVNAMEQASATHLVTKWKINHHQSKKTIPLNTRPFHLSSYYTRRFIISYNYDLLQKVGRWIEEARKGRSEFSNIDLFFSFFLAGLLHRGTVEVMNSILMDVRKGILSSGDEGGEEEEEEILEQEDDEPSAPKRLKQEMKKVSFKPEVTIRDFDYEPMETILKVNQLNWHLFCFLKEVTTTPTTTAPALAHRERKRMKIDANGDCNFSCIVNHVKEIESMDEFLAKVNVKDYKLAIRRILGDLAEEKEKMVPANKKDLGGIGHVKRIKVKYVILLDDLSRELAESLMKRVTEIKVGDGVTFPTEAQKELLTDRFFRYGSVGKPQKDLKTLFKNKNLEEVKSLLATIKLCEADGASAKDIRSFGYLSDLEDILQILLDNHWILFCGVSEIRYVHCDHKEPWIVKSYEQPAEQEEAEPEPVAGPSRSSSKKRPHNTVQPNSMKRAKVGNVLAASKVGEGRRPLMLRMFPWIRVTGTINQRVVDKVMGTILLFLQGKTGIPLPELFERFSYFHEAHLMLLLLAMKDGQLVKLYKLQPQEVSLWSSYQSPVLGK